MQRPLRIALLLGALFLIGGLAAGCGRTRGPAPRDVGYGRNVQEGLASFYGDEFHGRTTANGEIFDQEKLTAAHRTLPFGTRVRVTNLENGRRIEVRVNDRGPFVEGRIIDLSRRGARELGFLQQGLVRVRVEVL